MKFDEVLEARLKKARETLAFKVKEYATEADRFHNFRVAGRIAGVTPEKALYGMWLKHIVSVIDIIENPFNLDEALIDEKIGDCVNYLLLLEGLLKERYEKRIDVMPVE